MANNDFSIEDDNTTNLNNTDIRQKLGEDWSFVYSYGDDSSGILNDPYDPWSLTDPESLDGLKDEFNRYVSPVNNSSDNTVNADFSEDIFENNTQIPSTSNHVSLSTSVDTAEMRKPVDHFRPIEIVETIENDYKPRYKSDYCSQRGKLRKPRYVTDQDGNNFISLRVAPGLQGHIRIDWLTVPNKDGFRFSMPYKFQDKHLIEHAPDYNPLYKPIHTDSNGIMKIQLVLIKSKQDELSNAQPLQVFPPIPESADAVHLTPKSHLPPKELIEQFQLKKSQIAFTYCSINPNGITWTPHWNTTVYSTVLTEKSGPKSTSSKKIPCPNCSCPLELTFNHSDDSSSGHVVKKQRSDEYIQ